MQYSKFIANIILFFVIVIFCLSPISALTQTYDYLPGDVNMYYEQWPPVVWGNDVTYLRNHLMGIPECAVCSLTSFPASADANGECEVHADDFIHLINYFRGFVSISWCPDYPPSWPTPEGLPPVPPPGWPACENSLTINVFPAITEDTTDVEIWIGNLDGLPIIAEIGKKVNIDVYMQTTSSVWLANLHIPLGTHDQYIDSLLSHTEGQVYDSLAAWQFYEFITPAGSLPNPAGWSSQSLVGWARLTGDSDAPWLQFLAPTKIATFVVKVVNDPSIVGDTVECFDIGAHFSGWPLFVGDTMGISDQGYTIASNVSSMCFVMTGHLEGEVKNEDLDPIEGVYVVAVDTMISDSTDMYGRYLLAGIRSGVHDISFSHPSYSDTVVSNVEIIPGDTTTLDIVMHAEPFGCDFTPGDANGDGSAMGNDVTYSVRYFKGLGSPPPDSCPYDGGWLYSGGDANGNCSYTGSDVTFLVAYFKGVQSEILWCQDTPPIGGPAILGRNENAVPVVLPRE